MTNQKSQNIQEILRSYQSGPVDNSKHKQVLEKYLLSSDYFSKKSFWSGKLWPKISLVTAPMAVAALVIVLMLTSMTKPLDAQQVFAKAAESYSLAQNQGHILYSKYKITVIGNPDELLEESTKETWQDNLSGDFRTNTFNGEHLADAYAYIDGRTFVCSECTPFATGEEPDASQIAQAPQASVFEINPSQALGIGGGMGGGGDVAMDESTVAPTSGPFMGGGGSLLPQVPGEPSPDTQQALYKLFSLDAKKHPENRTDIFNELKHSTSATYNGNVEWHGRQTESIKVFSDLGFVKVTSYYFFDDKTFWLVGTVDVSEGEGTQIISTTEILDEYYTDDNSRLQGDDLFKTTEQYSDCMGDPLSEEIILEDKSCIVIYKNNFTQEALEKLGPNGDMNLDEYIQWEESQGNTVQVVE